MKNNYWKITYQTYEKLMKQSEDFDELKTWSIDKRFYIHKDLEPLVELDETLDNMRARVMNTDSFSKILKLPHRINDHVTSFKINLDEHSPEYVNFGYFGGFIACPYIYEDVIDKIFNEYSFDQYVDDTYEKEENFDKMYNSYEEYMKEFSNEIYYPCYINPSFFRYKNSSATSLMYVLNYDFVEDTLNNINSFFEYNFGEPLIYFYSNEDVFLPEYNPDKEIEDFFEVLGDYPYLKTARKLYDFVKNNPIDCPKYDRIRNCVEYNVPCMGNLSLDLTRIKTINPNEIIQMHDPIDDEVLCEGYDLEFDSYDENHLCIHINQASYVDSEYILPEHQEKKIREGKYEFRLIEKE